MLWVRWSLRSTLRQELTTLPAMQTDALSRRPSISTALQRGDALIFLDSMSALLVIGATVSLYASENSAHWIGDGGRRAPLIFRDKTKLLENRKEVNDHGQIYVHTYAAGGEILD